MTLGKYPKIIYAVSDAADGNMSYVRGDPDEALANRKKFLSKNKINLSQTVTTSLIHGIKIIRVGKNELGQGAKLGQTSQEADGIVTDQPGVFLFMLTADCLPISVYNPVKRAIGLFHAGRVGLYKGIIQQAIKAMADNFGSKPKDLLVGIGPSIGPCCYTTVFDESHRERADFVDYFTNPEWKPFVKINQNKVTLDLWSYTETTLKEQGILPENIKNQRKCTYHSGKYFSHRRFEDKGLKNDYRFATVLGIKDE